MSSTDLTPQRLMELVQKRLQILVKMKETYIEQTRSMADSEALLGTIARKQYLLDQLLAVHEEIAPFQEAGPESRNWPNESERQACQRIADEGQAILIELKSMEQFAIESLQQRHQAMQTELQMVQTALTMQQAYLTHDQEHAAMEGAQSGSSFSLES